MEWWNNGIMGTNENRKLIVSNLLPIFQPSIIPIFLLSSNIPGLFFYSSVIPSAFRLAGCL